MIDDLIALIAPVSPVLAKALSGPNSDLAVSRLGRAILNDEDATIDSITEALKSGDPELRLKISSAEGTFLRQGDVAQIQLKQLDNQDAESGRQALVKLETVAANDRASARQRQQITNDRTTAYLSYIVTVGFFLTVAMVMARPIKADTNPVAFTLLGILGTSWTSVLAFYFGSSMGSREKTAVLGESSTPPKSVTVSSDQ